MVNNFSIAEVIIDRRLPRQESYYDYLVGDLSLQPGDLVEISFRGRLVRGLIYNLKNSSLIKASKLKKIEKIVLAGYLCAWQINLLKWLSDNYAVSLGQAFLMFSGVQPNLRFKPQVSVPRPKKKLGQKLVYNLLYNDPVSHQKYVTTLIDKVINRGQQAVLLVPEVADIQYWQSVLHKNIPTLEFTSSTSQKNRQIIWQKIRNGESVCVIGTRAALWQPWVNLGGIIIDSAENENYKQFDQNPRYHAGEVAEYIGQLLSIPVAKISALPRLSDWLAYKKGLASWTSLGRIESSTKLLDISHKESKNFDSLLANELINAVTEKLGSGQIFLYINRLGFATSLICQDCNYRPVCKICERNLVWSDVLRQMSCFHCRLNFPPLEKCPRCQGVNFKMAGAGLDKLFTEVRHRWPQASSILITADNKEINQPELRSSQIVVGTRAAWSLLDKSKIKLIGLIDLTAELSQPEYGATEEVMAFIRNCQANTFADIVIQAKGATWETLQLINQPLDFFYDSELSKREIFGYPPVVSLIKVICQDEQEIEAKKQATKVFIDLKKKFPRLDIIGPYPDYYRQLRGRFRFYILLKYKATDDLNMAELSACLSPEVSLDKNPLHVLT